jgi:two-component system chemotaxis response regulator CheY
MNKSSNTFPGLKTALGLKTVLIVEDDVCIREILQYALQSEGYHVTSVENGKRGMEQLAKNPPPSIVLLDMMMPVMNGREFLDAIRANEMLQDLPVVVFSANSSKKNAMGANAFLRKPTDLDSLIQTIESYRTLA